MFDDQERQWRETVTDTLAIESEPRRGGLTPTEVAPKLLHDISVALSRLVAKSKQIIGNHTTNLAECWMHIRAKFDGGKVINRSQSGSWDNRCMGAGLRQNMGTEWGPQTWKNMTTTSPNKKYFLQQQIILPRKSRLTGRGKLQTRQKKVDEGVNISG